MRGGGDRVLCTLILILGFDGEVRKNGFSYEWTRISALDKLMLMSSERRGIIFVCFCLSEEIPQLFWINLSMGSFHDGCSL